MKKGEKLKNHWTYKLDYDWVSDVQIMCIILVFRLLV